MNSKQFDTAVYIGRFQPFHQGHLACVREGLRVATRIVILIGSIDAPRSFKNPWSYQERRRMIMTSLTAVERQQVIIRGIRDYDNDQLWSNAINKTVNRLMPKGIALIGFRRDSSSYYLDLFPNWKLLSLNEFQDVSATQVRFALYTQNDIQSVTRPVADFLRRWLNQNIFKDLVEGKTKTRRPNISDVELDPV